MTHRPSNLFWGTATLMIVAILAGISARPPAIRTDSSDQYLSVHRTAGTLGHLLAEGVPHPVGSAANRRVKERLLGLLELPGVTTEEQRTVGCSSRWPRCAYVENVIATIPGKSQDTALLMAHYDSVPNAPGAGDDGAAVATLIEVARRLALEAPHRNTLAFVFTDAEEDGLLGAEAFFSKHPLADRARAVINVEGSGTAGRARLLRSTPGSATIVDLFRTSATAPVAQSMATEVFRRMPNDTDFSVAMRAGIKGLDFAFADERNHYHTPLDSVANLDLRTLQHHGDNILPLARALADAELDPIEGELAYSTVGRWWIRWPEAWTVTIASTALILLLASLWLSRPTTPLPNVLRGVGVFFLSVIASTVCAALILWITSRLAGGLSSWPAHLWPWRLLLIGAVFSPALMVGRRFGRGWATHLGVWLVWASLSLALSLVAPLAANVLLIPTLFAALATMLVSRSSHAIGRSIAMIACVATSGYLFTELALAMEGSQGYLLAPTFYLPMALLATTLLSTCDRDDSSYRWLQAGAGVALAGGVIGALVLPMYSSWRPQHLNLRYIVAGDDNTALWSIPSDRNLPATLHAASSFSRATEPVYPWSNRVSGWQAPAPASADPPPEIEILGDQLLEDGRHVELLLRSPRGASGMILLISKAAGIRSIQVSGTVAGLPDSTVLGSREYLPLDIRAVPATGAWVSLVFSETEPKSHFLMDRSYSLPEFGDHLIEARKPLAVPVHSGDQSLNFTQVDI